MSRQFVGLVGIQVTALVVIGALTADLLRQHASKSTKRPWTSKAH